MTDLSSPPPSVFTSKIPNLEDFLKNISPEDPAGPSLRYEIVYDEIRLSRQEDDPRLSMVSNQILSHFGLDHRTARKRQRLSPLIRL